MNLPKFNVVENKEAFHKDLMCIEILEGDYAGVMFQYDNIRMEEKSEDDVRMHFNFITIKNEQGLDLTEEPFIDTIGEILNELLRNFVDADRTDGAETPSE